MAGASQNISLTTGERIRLLRKRARLSQPGLAERIGVSERQLARYENDQAAPPGDVLVDLVLEFGVSSDYLLGLSESAKRVFLKGKSPDLQPITGEGRDSGAKRLPLMGVVRP